MLRERKTQKSSPASVSWLEQGALVCSAESGRPLAGVLSALLQRQLLVPGQTALQCQAAPSYP